MKQPDFKTALAAYKSYRKLPKSDNLKRDLVVLDRLFKRIVSAAKREKVEIRAEHLQ